MTGKEFLKLLDELTESLKEYLETREKFVEKLTDELCAYIKEHYPGKKPIHIADKLKSDWCKQLQGKYDANYCQTIII